MYNSFSSSQNNLNNLDPVSRLKMKRDHEMNIPNYIQNIDQNMNYNNNNNLVNNIPNALGTNQNVQIQPSFNNRIVEKMDEPHTILTQPKFQQLPSKKSNKMKEYIIIFIIFIILSIKPVRLISRTSVPIIKNFENEIPACLFRGLIFVSAIFIYRRFK